jgi:uncharacterized Zn-binding protein involved in type VI secretion
MAQDAARVMDPTGHPGVVSGPGVPTVTIGGRIAAVAGDTHTCALPPVAGPHPPTNFPAGSKTVRIGGKGALRVGDLSGCGAPILAGAYTVKIGG